MSAQAHQGSQSYPPQDLSDYLPRRREATDKLSDLRLSELKGLKDDLDCLDRVPKARKWQWASGACVTTALGGLLGLLLLFDESAEFAEWVVPVYLSVLGLLLLLAGIFFYAARDMNAERVTSARDVSKKLQVVIDSYSVDEGEPVEPTSSRYGSASP